MRQLVICVLSCVAAVFPSALQAQSGSGSGQQQTQQTLTRREEVQMRRRLDDLKSLELIADRAPDFEKLTEPIRSMPELDKGTKERVSRLRTVDGADVETYRSFLKAERSGIFKIFPNVGCMSKNVVSVDERCSKFVPQSSDYSFRRDSYTSKLFHDIGLDNEILSEGFFAQGILVILGQTAIENVSLQTPGVKYLTEMPAPAEPAEARDLAARAKTGFVADGFRYRSRLQPAEGGTYALRSISYRLANSLPDELSKTSLTDLMFRSLEFDKRVDTITVFKVVRIDDNNGVTIVWKELLRKESPKLRFAKGERIADL